MAFPYAPYVGLAGLGALLTGIAVVAFGPHMIVAGTALMIVSVICWTNPALYMQGFLVVALALPAGYTTTRIFSIQIRDYHVLWTDVLLGLVTLRWVLGKATGRRRAAEVSRLSKRLSAIIAVLLFYSSISVARGLLEYGDVNVVLFDARPIFYYIVILIAFDYLQTRQEIEGLARGGILGLFLYCLFVISCVLMPTSHPLAPAVELVGWDWANRITFPNSGFLLLAIPMVLFLLSSPRVATLTRIGIFFALVTFIIVLVLSMSRTIALLIPLSVTLSYVVDSRASRHRIATTNTITRLLIVVALFLGAVVISVDQILPLILKGSTRITLETYARRFDLRSAAAQEAHVAPRIVMLRTAVSLILRNPLMGYGFGYSFALEGWQSRVTFVDNAWLTAWIRLGLVGVLPLVGLIILLLQAATRLLERADLSASVYAQTLVVSLVGSAIPFLIQSLNTSWLVSSTAAVPLLVLAGAFMGFSSYQEDEPSEVSH